MVKFFLEILGNTFTNGVLNIFPSALFLLLPNEILNRLQNLVLRLTKRKIDIQIISYLMFLPITICVLAIAVGY